MESIPIEIERKFIVKKPDPEKMKKEENYTSSEILQIYLSSAPGVTHRIRMRDFGERVSYTETVKRRIDRISSYEDEREISKEEFEMLRTRQRQGTNPVHKVRHTFVYHGKTFELDVYPKWRRTCIMEIELRDRSERVDMPPFIEIVKEVTGDKFYSNANMSASFPKECGD